MPKTPVSLIQIEKYAHTSLKRWIKKAMAVPAVKKRSGMKNSHDILVDLKVCGLAKMTSFNTSYRGKKQPTDILSFEAPDLFKQQGVLGDLLLCGPVALKQASEMKHTWQKEIDVLLVHGILHLCGFDHEHSKKEAKEMQTMEKRLLGAVAKRSLISRHQ